VHIDGPYELERPSTAVAGAWEARGAADFATGVAQDVLRTGCAGFGQYPGADCPADFAVVKRDGDDLFFGARPADNDMCTAARRPTALSPVANHRR
jgi:hypothetical protein